MKSRSVSWIFLFSLLFVQSGNSGSQAAEENTAGTAPVSMVVTVEAKHGKQIPVVYKEDVRAFHGNDRLRVTDWIPLQGENANLELLILIDEASRETLAMQYDDIRQFINGQPPSTSIAIGYMQYGAVRMAQNFTKDHEAAGKALRIPLGPVAAGSSPYLAIADVIKGWPASAARHTIFLVSSGIDPWQPGYVDTYLDKSRSEPEHKSAPFTPRRRAISGTVSGDSAVDRTT